MTPPPQQVGVVRWYDTVFIMKLYLVRHAESLSNKANLADSQTDVDLSPEGKEDSERLAKELKEVMPDICFVSPLKRTRQTLQPFLDIEKSSTVIESELLLERDLGEFTGTPMGAFQEYCRSNNTDLVSARPPGGESLVDVYDKTKRFLEDIKKSYLDKKVLVCGSKNNLMCLQIAIEGKGISDYYLFPAFKTGEMRSFEIK